MTALTTPNQIARYRLATLRAALKLEIAGMKRRGRSAYSILKNEGFTGTRAAVFFFTAAAASCALYIYRAESCKR